MLLEVGEMGGLGDGGLLGRLHTLLGAHQALLGQGGVVHSVVMEHLHHLLLYQFLRLKQHSLNVPFFIKLSSILANVFFCSCAKNLYSIPTKITT